MPLLMSPVEVGQYGGFADDLGRLRRDNSVLTAEIVRLRQAQAQSNAALEALSQRLSSTEQKQQQMFTALSQVGMMMMMMMLLLLKYAGGRSAE